MKRFIRNLLIGLLPVFCINVLGFGLLVVLSMQDDLTYVNYASALDKVQRLKSLDKESRLVIIGGSNTRFGFDSQVLRDSLRREPVNMGIHIGLGLNYMFDEVEPYLHAGDLLLVSAEYNHFIDKSTYDGGEAVMDMHLIKHEWGAALWQMIDTHYFFALYRLNRRRIKRIGLRLEDIPEGMEIRTRYNLYGDYVGHYGRPATHWQPECLPKFAPCVPVLNDIQEKVEALVRRGVKVCLVPPPYCQSSYRLDEPVIKNIATSLQQRGMKFILSPADCVYPDSLFYDTHYHLNHEAAILHSQKVAARLQELSFATQ